MSSESGGLPPGQAVLVECSQASTSLSGDIFPGGTEKNRKNEGKVPVVSEAECGVKEKEPENSGAAEEEEVGSKRPSFAGKALYSDILSRKKKEGDEPRGAYLGHRRKNVVRLVYTGDNIPDRDTGGKIIMRSLGFSPMQVFAFIHIPGTRDFDISFKNVAFLDTFWTRYSEVRNDDIWKDFEVVKISQNAYRNITILFKNESVPAYDVSYWLKRHCDEVQDLAPIYDNHGFWIGGYNVHVKLHSNNCGVIHLPNFLVIGRDRGYLFYAGQPRVCNKCGSNRHFGADCTKIKCSRCGEEGHFAKSCKFDVRCNLCNETGHLYNNCPKSEKNSLPSVLWSGLSVEEEMDAAAEALEGAEEGERACAEGAVKISDQREEEQGLLNANKMEDQGGEVSIKAGKKTDKKKNLSVSEPKEDSVDILNSVPIIFRCNPKTGIVSDVISDVMTSAKTEVPDGGPDAGEVIEWCPEEENEEIMTETVNNAEKTDVSASGLVLNNAGKKGGGEVVAGELKR